VKCVNPLDGQDSKEIHRDDLNVATNTSTVNGVLLGRLTTCERELRRLCEGLDPDAVPLPEVVSVFARLDAITKLAAGAQLRLARKLDDANAAAGAGARSTAEYLATKTGTSVGAAQDVLATSQRLATQGHADAAVARGLLSGDQARLVTEAAAVDANAERGLLDLAQQRSVKDLRDECATVKANADPDPAATRERLRRARSCRTWKDREGAWNLALRHLPEVGAEIEALLAPFTHTRFEAGRQSGQRESRDAYRADAMLDLARASGSGASPKGARRADTKVFVHIDAQTLLSGERHPESVCHIDGIGPVDVDHVRSLFGEAFVVALIHDGQDVRRVVHLGRQVTAHQRSALEARGQCCEVPGCDIDWGLEIDHITGWALTKTTTLDDLGWLCGHHHDQKTHHGYRLTGPPGNRTWIPPPRDRAA
jgi:hypothetical protein